MTLTPQYSVATRVATLVSCTADMTFTFVLILLTGALLSGAEADLNRLGENDQSGNKAPSKGPPELTTKTAFDYFDGELLQAVSREIQGNIVISPASVKTLLGLIFEASDGVTLNDLKFALRLTNNTEQNRQLLKTLQVVLKKMNTSSAEVDSETNVFLSKDLTLNTSYSRSIQDIYKAGVDSVDFKSSENAASTINSWVRTNTRGKITSIVDSGMLSDETMAVLVNTVYFEAKWKLEFKLRDTAEECFYSEPDLACSKVPIMFKEEELNYKFDRDLSSHVVQIPYEDERFSMVLVVPSTRSGIRRIARDVSKLTFPALTNKMKTTETHIRLPRFSAEFESDVKMVLTKMGLGTLFSEEANIPYMINNRQARISDIVHKAKIEVSEKGSKAAAATGASVVPLMSGNDPVFITADHPFYYFIYETESGSVLFSGRVSSLDGKPGVGKEEYGTDSLTRLSGGEFDKPRPASVNSPPGFRPSGPGPKDRPEFSGSENNEYSIGSPFSSYDPLVYPTDNPGNYLAKRGREINSHSFRSNRRTSSNH